MLSPSKCFFFLFCILPACLVSSISLACSNIFIAGKGVAAVARTMDLELNTGNAFGFGAKGWLNTSNINFPQQAPIHPMHWENKYAFLGQTAFRTYVIVDGMNTQGLYAAFLDLPDVTRYPTYDPNDKRPELGLMDLPNYVLGTSATVPEAINNILKTQVVKSAFILDFDGKAIAAGNAVHLVLRDRLGNNATIEWVKQNAGTQMHIYFHRADENRVVEMIPGSRKKVIFRGVTGSAVTNSPVYSWQLQNAARYNWMFTGASKKKVDGIYMNGSGMAGLPGSWMPPSRFARATQLARLAPAPRTENEAMVEAWNVLETMKVPLGSNPAMSLWATVSDLKNGVYYFKVLMGATPNKDMRKMTIQLPAFNVPFKRFDVKAYARANKLPSGWVSAQVKQQKIISAKAARHVDSMVAAPTPGNERTQIILNETPLS